MDIESKINLWRLKCDIIVVARSRYLIIQLEQQYGTVPSRSNVAEDKTYAFVICYTINIISEKLLSTAMPVAISFNLAMDTQLYTQRKL